MASGSPGPSDVLLSREIRIRAAPRTVFEFLVVPGKLVRWMGTDAALDPRPGGIYHVNVNGHETGWDDGALSVPPGSTIVEIVLEPDGQDTRLRLTHQGLGPDMRPFHDAGWRHYLNRLAVLAAGCNPGPDPHTTTIGTVRLGVRHLPRSYLYRFPRRRLAKWLNGRRPLARQR